MVPRRESFVFFFGFRFLGPSRLFVRPGTFPLSPRFGFFVVPVFGWVRLPLLCFTSASLPLRKLEGQTLPCLTRSLVTRGRDTPPYKQVSFVGLACPVYQPPGRRLRTRSWCVSSCGPWFVFRRRGLHWEHRLAEPPPRLPPSLWTLGPREEPLLALFRRLVTRPFRCAGGPLSPTPFVPTVCFGPGDVRPGFLSDRDHPALSPRLHLFLSGHLATFFRLQVFLSRTARGRLLVALPVS